jgi:hypothetical protein
MTTNPLPHNLYKTHALVKSFIEKTPQGASFTVLQREVKEFGQLSKSDRDKVCRYIHSHGLIHVFSATIEGVKKGRPGIYFFHSKYGQPTDVIGLDVKSMNPFASENKPANKKSKTVSDLRDLGQLTQPDITKESVNETEKPESTHKETAPKEESQEDLIKQAMSMLAKAERADRERFQGLTKDIQTQFLGFVERINQANDAVQSTLDKLYDQMADLDNITTAFKKFSKELIP